MFSIVTLNVLADSYTKPFKKRVVNGTQIHSAVVQTSVSNKVSEAVDTLIHVKEATQTLKLETVDEILSWERRNKRLEKTLRNFAAEEVDVICLQECDHYADFYYPLLKELKYECQFKQRPGGKDDGVLIAWRTFRFSLRLKEEVDFNDLGDPADLATQKHNVAIICLLEKVDVQEHIPILVSNCHLHWEPESAELKLMQAELLLQAVSNLRRSLLRNDVAVFVCGDFNSTPESNVYQLITQGKAVKKPLDGFICDSSLGKVAKYLRAIGVDCIYDEKAQGVSVLDICQKYRERIFLTRSRSIISRRSCPKGSILIHSQKGEDAFLQVLEETNLQLDESKFYKICVKCNGTIFTIERHDIPLSRISFETKIAYIQDKPKAEISEPNKVPKTVYDNTSEPLAMCNSCKQIYWWDSSDSPISRKPSSSARIQELVERLSALAETLQDKSDEGLDKITNHDTQNIKFTKKRLLQQERTYKSDLELECANVIPQTKETEYTNITKDFQGTIDYIFFNSDVSSLDNTVLLPQNYDPDVHLPNSLWPSDHRCIKSSFKFAKLGSGVL